MRKLQTLQVASEAFPLVKTGGMAEVVGALPAALSHEGVEVRTLLPGYPAVTAALRPDAVHELPDLFGGPARLLAGTAAGLALFCLDAPHLFNRAGSPYAGPDGVDWPDNAQRFAALSRAGALVARGAVPGYAPAVVHGHDWQAGLLPAYLHYGSPGRPGTVFTVHNMAFQGCFPAGLLGSLGLPEAAFTVDGVVHYCVAIMPGSAPLTSSEALGNATLPFGLQLADHGLDALKKDAHLARGLNVLNGELTHPAVAEALGRDSRDPYGVWAF